MSVSYKHNRLSGDFINLTDNTISLYESFSGQIWNFPPSAAPLPEVPYFDPDKPLLHYVVEPEVAAKLEKSGRSLEDIAIIDGKTTGRRGHEITKLVWGEKPSVAVRLYQGFKKDPYVSRKSRKSRKKPPKRA